MTISETLYQLKALAIPYDGDNTNALSYDGNPSKHRTVDIDTMLYLQRLSMEINTMLFQLQSSDADDDIDFVVVVDVIVVASV